MAQERKAQAKDAPRGAKSDSSAKLAGETRKLAAAGTGYSGSSLDKVDKIRDAAERVELQKTNPVTIRSHCRQHGPFHAGTGWDVNPVNTG